MWVHLLSPRPPRGTGEGAVGISGFHTALWLGWLRTAGPSAQQPGQQGQGCSGNQSSRYYRHEQSYREAERFGSTIGGEAVRVLKD